MIIRKATLSDIPDMGILWMKLMKEIYPDHNPNMEWWIQDRTNEMQCGIYCAFVVDDQMDIIGYADLQIYRSPVWGCMVALIPSAYILKGFRHKGISKKLYLSIKNEAISNDVQKIIFSCSDTLLDFWIKYGFQKTDNIMTDTI
jgi:N-acetylglutamate synthase-like GNAT family acetyltransferase